MKTTKGRRIYDKAVLMLGAKIDETVIHKIETIADDFDYTDDDNEQAEVHKQEAEDNGRQMTDPFLSRVANYNDPDSEDNYPADPAQEIMSYLRTASHGVITPQWTELREFIDDVLNPKKEEKAKVVSGEKKIKDDKKAASVAKKGGKKKSSDADAGTATDTTTSAGADAGEKGPS